MIIVYATRTGNCARFAKRLAHPVVKLTEGLQMDEPFVLVTYTDGSGEVPAIVSRFLAANRGYLRGVAASGSRNFGANYALAADLISRKYNVPVLLRFELTGTPSDIRKFNEEVTRIDADLQIYRA